MLVFDIVHDFHEAATGLFYSLVSMTVASALLVCITNWFYAKRVTDDIDKLKE